MLAAMAAMASTEGCSYSVAIQVVARVVYHVTHFQDVPVNTCIGVGAVEAAMGSPPGSLKVRPRFWCTVCWALISFQILRFFFWGGGQQSSVDSMGFQIRLT